MNFHGPLSGVTRPVGWRAIFNAMANFEKIEGPKGDGDIIVIHLGCTLSDTAYQAVVNSVVAFMNKRWPNGQYDIPS